jgi:hypothetical protein
MVVSCARFSSVGGVYCVVSFMAWLLITKVTARYGCNYRSSGGPLVASATMVVNLARLSNVGAL